MRFSLSAFSLHLSLRLAQLTFGLSLIINSMPFSSFVVYVFVLIYLRRNEGEKYGDEDEEGVRDRENKHMTVKKNIPNKHLC